MVYLWKIFSLGPPFVTIILNVIAHSVKTANMRPRLENSFILLNSFKSSSNLYVDFKSIWKGEKNAKEHRKIISTDLSYWSIHMVHTSTLLYCLILGNSN